MKIAVTGASGFLGRYIVNHLLREGHTCRCWYREGSDRGGFEEGPGGLEWMKGRLGEKAAAEAIVDGVDAVAHAALDRAGGGFRAIGDLIEFAQLNVMGSLELMQAARKAGVGRFVFISTCAVYDRILEDRPLDEAHPLWPNHHYGAHKAAIEKFVHSYAFDEGWDICALRPTGIYGLARPVRASKWYEVVKRVKSGQAVDSDAGGKEVHAADVARAVGILLEAPGIAGQAYNCCDMYVSEEMVARIAKELTGSASVISDRNHGPKNMIQTGKLRALGMKFGGEALLRETVREMLGAE